MFHNTVVTLYTPCRRQVKNVAQTSKGPKAENKSLKHLTTLSSPVHTLWWVWLVTFICLCRSVFPPTLVNLLSFPSVGISETFEAAAGGLGDIRLLQNTWGQLCDGFVVDTYVGCFSEHIFVGWWRKAQVDTYHSAFVIFPNSCNPAGCGQFLAVCARLDGQNRSLDDWLRKDSSLATRPHLGPPHALGGGQSRRWLPMGSWQPHWYTRQHAATDLNASQTCVEHFTLIFLHQSEANDFRWICIWSGCVARIVGTNTTGKFSNETIMTVTLRV